MISIFNISVFLKRIKKKKKVTVKEKISRHKVTEEADSIYKQSSSRAAEYRVQMLKVCNNQHYFVLNNTNETQENNRISISQH